MKYIAIIGAGNVGGRHLQALAALKEETCIQLVDVDWSSLNRAVTWFYENDPGKHLKIELYQDIHELHSDIDLAIIATSSSVRAVLTEQLLSCKHVKFLILEKVLFQTIADYERIKKLIYAHGCKAWVNCPRRTVTFYNKLASLLVNEPWLQCSVTGSNWGLSCNAIHFLDLFCFLRNLHDSELVLTAHLDAEILKSKREGYCEYTGYIEGFAPSFSIVVSSEKVGSTPPLITLQSPNYKCTIYEFKKEAELLRAELNWEREIYHLDSKYQSELTNLIVDDIFDKGDCQLTTYDESISIHVPFIKAMLEAINRDGGVISICPIT